MPVHRLLKVIQSVPHADKSMAKRENVLNPIVVIIVGKKAPIEAKEQFSGKNSIPPT